ncbi:branched-chain amino acid ABC transporter permease [Agaricicola taiwanensis]|uniref:Branched-chain amino acid ABC transporter permease n=1 Tax=Agaricicola taiwanensis TaxID=591372 RepID=A0A8J2YHX0_9RHOB|nr:branched-chain amino acid ABC transporter permease [Agaricicola taiwanensis]GGE43461.1 branched-chain amino acid ABC transporter permease [Agaricicola taiwanensis]
MTLRLVLIAAATVLAIFGLAQADAYVIRLATIFGMYATLALSWNIIGGFAGYPSFATAAFFGLGAYITAVGQNAGLPLPVAVALSGAVAALFAGLLGTAILHLRGRYFAIASLVVAEVLRELTNSWTDVTGGGMGINLPLIDGSVIGQAQFYLVAMLSLAAIALAATIWLDRSRLGMALRCIAQNEDAAQIIGVDTRKAKTFGFMLSSLFVGFVGGVYASWVTYIDPTDVYDGALSIKPILMALLGGVGTIFGPLLGAFTYLALEELLWRNLLEFHAGILGLMVVLLVLFLPGGLSEIRGRGLFHLLTRRRQPS